jgi:hypothetical protein
LVSGSRRGSSSNKVAAVPASLTVSVQQLKVDIQLLLPVLLANNDLIVAVWR